MRQRLVLAVIVSIGMFVVGAASASASAPSHYHFTKYPSGTYEDDSLCSFPVYVNGTDTFSERDYSDGSIVFTDNFSGTVTANGITLNKSEAAQIIWGADGSTTWKGLAASYSYPNGPVIAADRGVIAWDANNNLLVEQGPHPIFDGPGTAAVCAVLSG